MKHFKHTIKYTMSLLNVLGLSKSRKSMDSSDGGFSDAQVSSRVMAMKVGEREREFLE